MTSKSIRNSGSYELGLRATKHYVLTMTCVSKCCVYAIPLKQRKQQFCPAQRMQPWTSAWPKSELNTSLITLKKKRKKKRKTPIQMESQCIGNKIQEETFTDSGTEHHKVVWGANRRRVYGGGVRRRSRESSRMPKIVSEKSGRRKQKKRDAAGLKGHNPDTCS